MPANKITDRDRKKALKKLIDETVESGGKLDPADIPYKVKDRIRRQASGDLDVDDYVKQADKDRSRTPKRPTRS